MNGDSVALILPALGPDRRPVAWCGGYVLRKRQLEALLELARQLPEAYLAGEVMPRPPGRMTRCSTTLLRQVVAGPCWSR